MPSVCVSCGHRVRHPDDVSIDVVTRVGSEVGVVQMDTERSCCNDARSRTRGERTPPARPIGARGRVLRWAFPLLVLTFLTSCSVAMSHVSVAIGSVILVVGNAGDPTVGDERLRDHLRTGLAADVRVVSQDEDPRLTAVDLVVIAQSSDSGAVGDRYTDAPVPVLVLNNSVWGDMLLAAGSENTGEQTSVLVLDGDSPTAGALSPGPHRVLTTGSAMRFVVGLTPDAVPVAAAGDDSSKVVMFTIDAGARLTQGVAPARRVGLGARDDAYDRWLAPAWDLFDGSVAWLLGQDPVALDRTALLVSDGGIEDLNASEMALRSRLRSRRFDVTATSDVDLREGDGASYDVVVMSKTVDSGDVGAKLKSAATGVVFWEDNQQQLSMMATIDDDGSSGTAWHSTETQVDIAGDAPDVLTGEHRGRLRFYTQPDETCWAPTGSLTADAIPIARTTSFGPGSRAVVYAYDREGRLADGSRAAGRRVFFGLYDDSFRYLTLDAVALFDATLEWAAEAPR